MPPRDRTDASGISSDLESPLLRPRPAARVKNPGGENVLSAAMARLETAIPRAFLTRAELLKEKHSLLSPEELITLYEDPRFENVSGFDRLKELHPVAPPPIPYNPDSPLRNLIRLSGTTLELVFLRIDFWALLTFHVIVSCVYFGGGREAKGGLPLEPGWPKIDSGYVAIPGSLITFILVFYLNQTYSRFLSVSANINGIRELFGEFFVLLRVHLPDSHFADARFVRHYLCKLANALHILSYSSLPHNRDENINQWAWWYLQKSKLLNASQVNDLHSLESVTNGSLVYKELLLWLNRGVWAQESRGHVTKGVAGLFTTKLLEIRTFLDGLYSFASGPVPFAYYHLLNFVLLVYLFILAYVFTFVTPYWSIPVFGLILIGLLGIREVGNSMSNPLGSDKLDIAVFDVANKLLEESILLINRDSSFTGEIDFLTPLTREENLFAEDEDDFEKTLQNEASLLLNLS